MLPCTLATMSGETLARFSVERQKPWQQQLVHKGVLPTKACARVLMGPDQIFPGSNLVPADIEHAELSLYVLPSTLVRVVLGERANASGPGVKALFALPELDLPFESSLDCIATWKLKHLVNKYDELRGKPMSHISAKALEYVVNAFSDPRVGKRKLDVFQLFDQFVLPLVWNVTTDEMLLRQQVATAMPIVSTRTISEAGRVHLEAVTEDGLIQTHLEELQLTSIQPFKEMASVQESIAGVQGRRLCKLLQQDHLPFVRLLAPEQHKNGEPLIFLADVVSMVCNCQEEDAVQKLQAIKNHKGTTFLHNRKWLCGNGVACAHVIEQLPLASTGEAGRHCERIVRLEIAAVFARYLQAEWREDARPCHEGSKFCKACLKTRERQ